MKIAPQTLTLVVSSLQGGYVFVVVCLFVKTSKRICMKFSEKKFWWWSGSEIWIRIQIKDPDPYCNTGEMCLSRGMHCPGASSYHCHHHHDYYTVTITSFCFPCISYTQLASQHLLKLLHKSVMHNFWTWKVTGHCISGKCKIIKYDTQQNLPTPLLPTITSIFTAVF